MDYAISISKVEVTHLAAVQATVTHQTLGITIRQILASNKVYTSIKQANIKKFGHNVIVYKTDQQKAGEFVLEVGVQVATPFESDGGEVICSSTPSGKAITTTHIGPYDQLGKAHDAIMEWAKANNCAITGRNWEVYGDWEADPNQLTTQVFYLLQ
jgi:effector-binding domain-containing protein